MIPILIIFILTYVLMLSFPKYKHYIALFVALLFVAMRVLSIESVINEIDFNVLFMIFGTMGTVSLFIESKMPSLLADLIIKKVPNVKWMTICLAVFAGVISAFVDNVATVLMIAPVTIILAKKLKISPVPIIISVSIFSNLEGAATLVGDTTSILLAGAAKMDFLDFFFYDNKIGLFFIVQLGLIASCFILAFLQRKNTKKVTSDSMTKVTDYIPTVLLVLTILTLIIVSFIPDKPELSNGIICIVYYVIGLLIYLFKDKDLKIVFKSLKEIDYETLLLLVSLFVIIGAIKEVGVIDFIGNLFMKISSDNEIIMYSLIVFISVIISAFIDNIPYVATMIPVISIISVNTGMNSILLYYGLIIGATLGGNFTPIGASANITAIGILKKNGYELKNSEYYKYSVPISIAAILTGYIVILVLFI